MRIKKRKRIVDYEKFSNFSFENKKKISDLLRYKTTKSEGKWKSLQQYVEDMPSDQKDIYYITGENMSALINSPLLEQLKSKDFEVLLMNDPIDEWVTQALDEYDEKKLKSAERGDLDLDKVDEEKKGTYLPSSTSRFAYTGKNDKCTRNPIIASKTFQGIAEAMATQWSKI